MKRMFPLLTLSLAFLIAPTLTNAQVGSVMLQTKENVDKEKKDKHAGTENITIDITINGKPKDPETRVIKWTTFGKDQKLNQTVVIESGEIPVNLKSGSTQKTSTPRVTTSYKEKYTQPTKGGKQGRSSKPKEVPGDGVKYYGYGVEVLDGGAVIASKFDPRILEKQK